MSSYHSPRLVSFRAGGTIERGHVVKLDSDPTKVVECTAATDKAIGIAQNAAVSGELVQVAMPGGGAKAQAQAGIAVGDLLVSHTDGRVKKASAQHDRIIGVAMMAADANDIFSVEVIVAQATQAQA